MFVYRRRNMSSRISVIHHMQLSSAFILPQTCSLPISSDLFLQNKSCTNVYSSSNQSQGYIFPGALREREKKTAA